MKALKQQKALVGVFSVIVKTSFPALAVIHPVTTRWLAGWWRCSRSWSPSSCRVIVRCPGRGANTGQLGGWSWSLLIIKFVQLSRAGDLLIMIRELRRRGGEGEGDTEVSGRAGRRFELEPSFLTPLGRGRNFSTLWVCVAGAGARTRRVKTVD